MDPILLLLRRNARASIEDLARELNLSEAEVARRIGELEAAGVILGYQTVIDPQAAQLGAVTACIEVKITPERGGGFDRLAERIAKYDEVKTCYLMSGGYDLLVVVEGNNLRSLATFVAEKLSTIQGVISTSTHFMLKTYKEQGVFMGHAPAEERLAVSP